MNKLQKIGVIGLTILIVVLITYFIKPFKQFSNFKNVNPVTFVEKTFVSSDFKYVMKFLSEKTFNFSINTIENHKVIESITFDDSFTFNDGSICSKEKGLIFIVYSNDAIFSVDYHKKLFMVNDHEK